MLLDNKFISSIYYLVNKLDPLVFHIPQISYLLCLEKKKSEKLYLSHIWYILCIITLLSLGNICFLGETKGNQYHISSLSSSLSFRKWQDATRKQAFKQSKIRQIILRSFKKILKGKKKKWPLGLQGTELLEHSQDVRV